MTNKDQDRISKTTKIAFRLHSTLKIKILFLNARAPLIVNFSEKLDSDHINTLRKIANLMNHHQVSREESAPEIENKLFPNKFITLPRSGNISSIPLIAASAEKAIEKNVSISIDLP